MTPYIELLRAGRAPQASVYLLVGADTTVHHDVVSRLTRAWVQNPELNYTRIRAGEATRFEDIETAAEGFPMLSKRRLLWIDGSDRLSAAARSALAAYLPRANPSTVVILSAGQPAEAGTRRSGGRKKEATDNVEEVAGQHGVTIQCEIRTPRTPFDKGPDDRSVWLAMELERRGLSADVDARQALMGRLGATLSELRSELDKLQAYLGDRRAIQRADVEEVVCRSVVGSMMELSGLLQRRSVEPLLRLYRELIRTGAAPFQVLAYVGAIVRPTASTQMLTALVETEVAAKSGADPELAIELLLVQICQSSLKSPDPPVMRPRR